MLKAHEGKILIPEAIKMSALHKICPKEIRSMLETRWDEIKEDYDNMRGKVMCWATNKIELSGGMGRVPMEIGQADIQEEEEGDSPTCEEEDGDQSAEGTMCAPVADRGFGVGEASWSVFEAV